jgi:hypothetical protein
MKLSKKVLKEKYPKKHDVGEEVNRLFFRLVAIISVFVVAALSADIYQLLH